MLQYFNPLNAELNPVCHLLALLGAHYIFHVSGLRVKPLLVTVSFMSPNETRKERDITKLKPLDQSEMQNT